MVVPGELRAVSGVLGVVLLFLENLGVVLQQQCQSCSSLCAVWCVCLTWQGRTGVFHVGSGPGQSPWLIPLNFLTSQQGHLPDSVHFHIPFASHPPTWLFDCNLSLG